MQASVEVFRQRLGWAPAFAGVTVGVGVTVGCSG
jgi:hypothetical protein